MRVSFIIPCFNRATLIPATLRNVLAQATPDDEILVVDDGSTDGSPDAVRAQFGEKVTLIEQPNSGPGAARNAGLRAARGEFIQFLDSDDLLAEGSTQSALELLTNTGADIAVGAWVKAHIEPDHITPTNHVLQKNGLPCDKTLAYWLLTHWSIVPHQMLFRTALIRRAGEFPEDIRVAEDQEFFLRCIIAGAKVVACPDFLMVYREGNAGKISETRSSARLGEWITFLLRGREACINAGWEDPARWFAYRSRLWHAREDLRKCGGNADLENKINTLLAGRETPALYRAAEKLQRWRGGVQSRLTGGRAHPCFRAGPPSPSQRERIGKLRYL